jgi:hypothetical protein
MAEIIAALGWTLNVSSTYDLMPARGFPFHTACRFDGGGLEKRIGRFAEFANSLVKSARSAR